MTDTFEKKLPVNYEISDAAFNSNDKFWYVV
jgi:hypothetical protein